MIATAAQDCANSLQCPKTHAVVMASSGVSCVALSQFADLLGAERSADLELLIGSEGKSFQVHRLVMKPMNGCQKSISRIPLRWILGYSLIWPFILDLFLEGSCEM